MVPPPPNSHHESVVDTMHDIRADYSAAKDSRFRRKRSGVQRQGSTADWHMRHESDLFYMVELSRALVRNDIVLGPAIEKTVDHVIQDGFRLIPQTGDQDLDRELKQRFDKWSKDPDVVDRDGEADFRAIERQVTRAAFRDGEIFPLLHDDQSISLVETQRVRKPTNSRDSRCVFGIKLAKDSRRREQIWVTNDEIDPNKSIRLVNEITKISVRDSDTGLRVALQVCDPKRVSQTRCPPVTQPVIDTLSQIDDTLFAKLVQQQSTSVFAFIRTRDVRTQYPGTQKTNVEGATPGGRTVEPNEDGTSSVLEKYGPGLDYKAPPGEKVEAFSPNIPSPQFFEHMKIMLQLVNIHLHMPIVIYLLDASETNFSGWRGAVDAARDEFMRVQEWIENRFHRHVAAWWLHNERISDPQLDRRLAALGIEQNEFPHKWRHPVWRYIEPLKDAQAHAFRKKTLQVSPRDASAELGTSWDEIITETVEDNKRAIATAVQAATEINSEFPNALVTWRELLQLPNLKDIDVTDTAPTNDRSAQSRDQNTERDSDA